VTGWPPPGGGWSWAGRPSWSCSRRCDPPATGWQADAGWRDLARVVPLRNLRTEDSQAWPLACTFFEPAATQELAAERLGLPFSTDRYQLTGAVRRVTERLW
jgi:hypothetical protein